MWFINCGSCAHNSRRGSRVTLLSRSAKRLDNVLAECSSFFRPAFFLLPPLILAPNICPKSISRLSRVPSLVKRSCGHLYYSGIIVARFISSAPRTSAWFVLLLNYIRRLFALPSTYLSTYRPDVGRNSGPCKRVTCRDFSPAGRREFYCP